MSAVSVEGLAFGFGAAEVLEDVSFEVAEGEIFGVVGADGSGKSTLLRVLIGQLPASRGRVDIFGRSAGDPALRATIAYMPQSFGQYLDLSVQENLEFFAALHGLRGAQASALIADLVARAGLEGFEGRRAGQLSGGMMQKLALACALVSRPRAMFLDEPTTGVDPVSRRAFWQLLQGVRAEGVAIVYATANMQEAELCDRVATMENGALVRQGTPAQLIAAVDAPLLLARGEGLRARVAELSALPGVEFVFPVGREVKLWLAEAKALDAVGDALRRLGVGAERVTPGLHDVALRQLARDEREHAHG